MVYVRNPACVGRGDERLGVHEGAQTPALCTLNPDANIGRSESIKGLLPSHDPFSTPRTKCPDRGPLLVLRIICTMSPTLYISPL